MKHTTRVTTTPISPSVTKDSVSEPTVETVKEFDPATQPDMALIPASIGLTAMVAMAIFLGGIVVLDVASLKRDLLRLHSNVKHFCRRNRCNSRPKNKIHS